MVASALSPLTPGETLDGKYRVERILGQGGMGVVLAARHLALDERVAIKFLHGEAKADEKMNMRLIREARASAKIKSEHVVRVFDVATLTDGTPYIVMEYLEGRDLAQVLEERGRLDAKTTIELTLQVCSALAEAHAIGIVHRDLKPGNLFLTHRADGSACMKVLDFGISKTESTAALTQSRALMGSPVYMSPEQLQSSRDVDARSDLWSLGVVLFELLSGQPPFEGASLPQLCTQILHQPPRRLEEAAPGVPPALAKIVHRCLEKDANARFQTIRELATELASVDRVSVPQQAPVTIDLPPETRSSATMPLESSPSRPPSSGQSPLAASRAGTPVSIPVNAQAKRFPILPVAIVALLVCAGGAFGVRALLHRSAAVTDAPMTMPTAASGTAIAPAAAETTEPVTATGGAMSAPLTSASARTTGAPLANAARNAGANKGAPRGATATVSTTAAAPSAPPATNTAPPPTTAAASATGASLPPDRR